MTEGATRGGTTDRFRVLYRATLGDVFGYLLVHAGGNRQLAEDLTAETYLHAVRQFRHDPGVVTPAWLKTVAKRRLVDHWRVQERLNRKAERLRQELGTRPRSNAQEADRTVDRVAVYEALSRLAPDHRIVLTLKHLDDLSVAEIAVELGRTPKAIESLLQRARREFRTTYEAGDR